MELIELGFKCNWNHFGRGRKVRRKAHVGLGNKNNLVECDAAIKGGKVLRLCGEGKVVACDVPIERIRIVRKHCVLHERTHLSRAMLPFSEAERVCFVVERGRVV